MTINKQALREAATKAKELGNISRYTKAKITRLEFKEAATPDAVLALLDELEAAEKRIAEPVSVPDEVMAAMQKVARIRLDLNDFDGDEANTLVLWAW